MSIRPNLQQLVAVALLPVLTGVALPFVQLFWLNKGNLTLPLRVHLPWLALLCLALFGIAFAIQRLAPVRVRAWVSCAVFVFGAFAWAESTLLIGDFGFLQGTGIDWGDFRHLLYFEILIAVILAVVHWRMRTRILDRAVLVTCILVGSSLASLFPAWLAQRDTRLAASEYVFNQEQVFDLSADRNVLVYVLDTFQSDLFAEILARSPEWNARLDGFTYFPNATSGFPKTYASVSNLLTGEFFDNSQPFGDYLHDAYFGNSLPRVIKDQGFDVRLTSFTWQPYLADPALADNVSGIESRAGRAWMQRLEFVRLLNLTIFRVSPFLAKPWAYNHNDFRIRKKAIGPRPVDGEYRLDDEQRVLSLDSRSDDLELHDLFMAHADAPLERPAFRLFHYLASHPPLTVDRHLNVVGNRPPTRENVLEQSEGILEMLSRQIDRLRELGVYQNSTIVIVGDHGAGEMPDLGIAEGLAPERFTESSVPVAHVQGGIPLMVVKPAGARGPLQTSGAPVQLADVPNTVFVELGFDHAQDGPSMFEIDSSIERVRRHAHYQFAGWGQDYIVPMTEYEIAGFSWDPGAWSPSGRDLNQNAQDAVQGTYIILGEGGNLDDFAHTGWPPPRGNSRWIARGEATITVPVQPADGARGLEFRVLARMQPEHAALLNLRVNGEPIDRFELSKRRPDRNRTVIPASIASGASSLELAFELERTADSADSLRLIEIRVGAPREN